MAVCESRQIQTNAGWHGAAQRFAISAAARLPTLLSLTSRLRSSAGFSSDNTLFICPECFRKAEHKGVCRYQSDPRTNNFRFARHPLSIEVSTSQVPTFLGRPRWLHVCAATLFLSTWWKGTITVCGHGAHIRGAYRVFMLPERELLTGRATAYISFAIRSANPPWYRSKWLRPSTYVKVALPPRSLMVC